MAPAFLSKLVKQSPTTGPGSGFGSRAERDVPPARLRARTPSLPSSGSSDHSHPDVLVVPPSPSVSARSRQASPRQDPRTLSVADDPRTPTPERPGIAVRHSSSLTNLRPGQQPAPAERHRATTISARANGHSRALTDGVVTTSPPAMTLTFEDGPPAPLMTPIVESPSGDGPAGSRREGRGRAKPDALLVPGGGGDDARSVRSVSKGRSWMRSSSREPAAEPPASPVRERRRDKRPTGLGAALAASGMAIANPTVSVQHVAGSLSTTPARQPRRSASISSMNGVAAGGRHDVAAAHAPRLSVDGPVNPGPDRHERTKMSASSHGGSAPNTDIESALDESEDEDELDLDDDIPVTGFAVASTRRNAEFHELFPAVPEGDYLIEDYGCALARDILVQGRLYISENHLCFHANIFGWVTDLVIPMHDVLGLEKKMTALIIPNAVQVATRDAKYTFASFMARDTTFDVIYNVWRLARPPGSAGPSAEDVTTDGAEMTEGRVGLAAGAAPGAARKATQCACGLKGEHYGATPMDAVLPGTPEKIYNLMFASGFIKDFMRDNQKLTDIQISDWQPEPGTRLLARNMSYIKPLNGSIGPKSTKCELRDATAHFEPDAYISTLTTTRTPDVPSGGVFAVKTRTCITWASAVTSRVCVTSAVEWTGRSFIKSIIDKSAMDGQNTYHDALDKAMRAYIHEHRAEFLPEGVEPDTLEAAAEATPVPAEHAPPGGPRARERERSQRGLQWAYDTFEDALSVARKSTEGALDLLSDAWDQSSGTTVLYFVIALLVLSNAWTLAVMGRREEVGRRKGLRAAEEREKLVHGVVAGLWEEIAATRGPPAVAPRADGWQAEVDALAKGLDAIQDRLNGLRQSLTDASAGQIAPAASL